MELHNENLLLDVDANLHFNRQQCSIISDMFREYLYSLKKSMMCGDHFIKPDKSKISPVIWDRCKILSEKGFVIGGSVVLCLYGLIDREIGDIDVFLSTDDIDFDVSDHDELIETEDGHGYSENEQRIKINVPDIGTVDVFNKRQDFYVYDGVKINSPFSALKAKISYKRLKDTKDFLEIVKNIHYME